MRDCQGSGKVLTCTYSSLNSSIVLIKSGAFFSVRIRLNSLSSNRKGCLRNNSTSLRFVSRASALSSLASKHSQQPIRIPSRTSATELSNRSNRKHTLKQLANVIFITRLSTTLLDTCQPHYRLRQSLESIEN